MSVTRLGPGELREIEPHVGGLTGIRMQGTGIVDYKMVAARFVELSQARGAALRTEARVEAIVSDGNGLVIQTTDGDVRARFLVNCAGLPSDRIAQLAGVQTELRIVPFRGEHFELREGRRHLVKHLIYPVPDPTVPFLGVHFTRMIGGGVHAGADAVLSLKREGYTKQDISGRDLADVLTYPGGWRPCTGGRGCARWCARSASVPLCTASSGLFPRCGRSICSPRRRASGLRRCDPTGGLVDEFLILPGPLSLHVLKAPSPAATASIEIGRSIAKQIPEGAIKREKGTADGHPDNGDRGQIAP